MLLALSIFFGVLLFFPPPNALALEVCAGDRVYLKPQEEITIRLKQNPRCTVRHMTLERGTVSRRLHYASGQTITGTWSAGQVDDPKIYAEFPNRIYLKAQSEALVRFFAQVPADSARTPDPVPKEEKLMEVCSGQGFTLKAGEEVIFRFGQNCQTPVRHININGVLEEQVTYLSGKTTRRILRTGASWKYTEWPTKIVWKASRFSRVTFTAVREAPVVAREAAKPKTKQIQSQAPTQSEPEAESESIWATIGSSISKMASKAGKIAAKIVAGLLGIAILGGLVYLIIRVAQTSSTMVISHWYTLIDNLQASPKEFYTSVERAIERRKVPATSNSRVDWKEGGLFTGWREYLRVSREKHIFDICGAPYGTGFFVSWWLGELRPSPIGPLTVTILVIYGVDHLLVMYFGFLFGHALTLIVGLLTFLLVGILINQSHGEDWVRYVLAIPVLGWAMERLFLPPTYYRLDTALMFQSAIHTAVLEVVDEMTKAKGVRSLTELERKPILKEMFQRAA